MLVARTRWIAEATLTHPVSALRAGHTAPVQVLAFVQEGRRLIRCGNDARVLVWDVPARPERRSR